MMGLFTYPRSEPKQTIPTRSEKASELIAGLLYPVDAYQLVSLLSSITGMYC